MKKSMILVGLLALTPFVKGQLLLEALEGMFDNCSTIPVYHPIHRVAPGNYKLDGTFTNTKDESAYMYWNEAINYRFPTGWHLPTRNEFQILVPPNNVWNMAINTTLNDVEEQVQIGKAGLPSTIYKTFKSSYYRSYNGTIYGIRFKPSNITKEQYTPYLNDDLILAFQYKREPDGIVISVRQLKLHTDSLTTISNSEYWDNDSCNKIKLYYSGFKFAQCFEDTTGDYYTFEIKNSGVGYFWTADMNQDFGDYKRGWWWDTKNGFISGSTPHNMLAALCYDFQDTILLYKD